ncbi:hypothetical protein AOLI_G00282700 [Acnodon oligacanthus]
MRKRKGPERSCKSADEMVFRQRWASPEREPALSAQSLPVSVSVRGAAGRTLRGYVVNIAVTASMSDSARCGAGQPVGDGKRQIRIKIANETSARSWNSRVRTDRGGLWLKQDASGFPLLFSRLCYRICPHQRSEPGQN